MVSIRLAVVAGSMLLLGTCGTGRVLAQDEYPALVVKNFMIEDCTPSCLLCHTDPNGGPSWNQWGLANGTAAATSPASIRADQDFDQDGFFDVAELRVGSDPGNAVSTPDTVKALSFCLPNVPRYGCGARLARGGEDDGSAAAWLVIGLGAALSAARKRRGW